MYYFVCFLGLQSSGRGRESSLLCFVVLPMSCYCICSWLFGFVYGGVALKAEGFYRAAKAASVGRV